MEAKKDLKHFRDLNVYQKAFARAMQIFEITKSFPSDEKYFYPVKFEISFAWENKIC